MANVSATYPFQVIAVPNIPEPDAPPDYFLLSAANTVPTGINNSGQIVGTFLNLPYPNVQGVGPYGTMGFVESNGSYNTFYAGDANGTLCYPVGYSGACGVNLNPTGINDSGSIAGIFPGDQFGGIYGFVTQSPPGGQPAYSSVSQITYPGVQPGLGLTTVSGINNGGAMVGTYGYIDSFDNVIQGGYLLNGGVFTALSYTPVAINNQGQILGVDGNGNTLIDTYVNIRNLGALQFSPCGYNDICVIVGGDYLYFYPSNVYTQVNLQGESGIQINAINDLGQFVGTANGSDGQIGFAVTTPEPYEGFPLLVGMGAIALRRFRARRRIQSGRFRSSETRQTPVLS